jgi:hypothetical protein
VVTTTDPGPVRLRVPALRRWGKGTRLAVLGVVGVAVGVAGLSEEFAASTSVTVVGKIAFGVVSVACVALGGWLLRTGTNIARHLAGRVPVLTATATAVRLERPGRKAREVARDRVAAATFEVGPPRRGEPPLAYLGWLDADRRSLGTWTVDPVIRPGLTSFLRAIGAELLPPEPAPAPSPASGAPASGAPVAAPVAEPDAEGGDEPGDDRPGGRRRRRRG